MRIIIIILSALFQIILSQSPSCAIENCIKCSSDNKTCETCKNEYFYSRERNECLYQQVCPLGKYLNYSTSTCMDCDGTCRSCVGSKEYQCMSCKDGLYSVFYLDSFKCLTCSTPFCRICNSLDICQQCSQGFFLNKDRQCNFFHYFYIFLS